MVRVGRVEMFLVGGQYGWLVRGLEGDFVGVCLERCVPGVF